MLEQFLPTIKDPADYIAALSLFKLDAPLTREEAGTLLDIYAKYLPDIEDPDYLKICLATDLLPGRSEEDRADFAALELKDGELDALFTAKEIVSGNNDITAELANAALAQVRNETLALPVRVLLARVALDAAVASRDFASMREQIGGLAAFLTGCGNETLDRYTVLVGEVRAKCRK